VKITGTQKTRKAAATKPNSKNPATLKGGATEINQVKFKGAGETPAVRYT